MSLNLFWLQCGACGGDTMSLLCADSPGFVQVLDKLDLRVLWHPSMTACDAKERERTVGAITAGDLPLHILCVEGSVIRGPTGTGMYATHSGRPKKDLLAALAARAEHVIAVGTCASFGGIPASCEVEACGVQFTRDQKGGFLGDSWTSGSGMPVINLPGCPCHPSVVVGTLTALVGGVPLHLDRLGTPTEWYGMLVHQGCTRNEYHEYRVEEKEFGERGCLFFHMGCHGPLAHGPCNKLLWNRRSSKTRAGVPCFGCTKPGFPQATPFFETPNIENLPIELPEGVDRAHYMAYKGMAAAAAPERLLGRENEV